MLAQIIIRSLSFGTYRTIVLGRQQPTFEKDAPLVFHSTNLTTVGSRLFLSSSCRKKVFPGHEFSVAIERESPTTFVWKKGNFFASFYNFESRCKNTVTLLIVDSHVHRGTKFRYLSNDSFRSSTTFNREDCPLGVSFNKFDDRCKQTFFSGSYPRKISSYMNFRYLSNKSL